MNNELENDGVDDNKVESDRESILLLATAEEDDDDGGDISNNKINKIIRNDYDDNVTKNDEEMYEYEQRKEDNQHDDDNENKNKLTIIQDSSLINKQQLKSSSSSLITTKISSDESKKSAQHLNDQTTTISNPQRINNTNFNSSKFGKNLNNLQESKQSSNNDDDDYLELFKLKTTNSSGDSDLIDLGDNNNSNNNRNSLIKFSDESSPENNRQQYNRTSKHFLLKDDTNQQFESNNNHHYHDHTTRHNNRLKIMQGLANPSYVSDKSTVASAGLADAAVNNDLLESSDYHCHLISNDPQHNKLRNKGVFRKLIIVLLMCVLFMIAEIVGGILANSISIQTDAAHMAADIAGFFISILALYLSTKEPTKRMSFGYYRSEVLGALFSTLIIWLLTGILVYMAVLRIIRQDKEIDAKPMVITASCGVLFNIIMYFVLHTNKCIHGVELGHHGHSHGGSSSSPSHGQHRNEHINNSKQKHSHSHSHGHGSNQSQNHNHQHQQYHANCKSTVEHSHFDNRSTNDILPITDNYAKNNNINNSDDDYHTNDRNNSNINADQVVVVTVTGSNVGGGGRESLVDCDDEPHEQQHHNHNHDDSSNLNLRAAAIHVIGDFIQSIGVLIAAIIIYFNPDYWIADPICTFVFSVLVMMTTAPILKDIFFVLMEASPSHLKYQEILDDLAKLENVRKVHSLHIWSLTIEKFFLSAHLATEKNVNTQKILRLANEMLRLKHKIERTTIQIEEYESIMDSCNQCKIPN